ncbi:MAG: orotidine-5'-phosphate decarboxylase [Actinobacteria bacterium]|nr:orotidine-5'-phosphate decarboxylase [Actinomycetota bacterium]
MMNGRVIVALDLPTADAALQMAKRVDAHVAGFKIGLGLLYDRGPQLVDELVGLGRPVFVDAKLHDIPTQVERAAERIGARGARWVTAHASGGADMLAAAVSGLAQGSKSAAGILAVSVLTSLDDDRLATVGIDATPTRLVAHMARTAATVGCEGIVSSPHELATVIEAAPDLLRVTPGIRIDDTGDDQVRTATPAVAISAGADLLVVGRPITQSPDPESAAAVIAAAVNGIADSA